MLGGYESYEEHYNHVLTVITENEGKYTAADIEIASYDEDNQHAWDELVPGPERGRGCDHDRGEVVEREFDQEDIDDNAAILSNPAGSDSSSGNGPADLAHRFESAASKEIIPANEYRSLMRGLNSKQKEIVMLPWKWCKEAVIALKHGRKVTPYQVFVSGPCRRRW